MTTSSRFTTITLNGENAPELNGDVAIPPRNESAPASVEVETEVELEPEHTTCQICARPIKAKTGKIAHHGYQRPGNGWQTSSCRGARHLPYEKSCDLIPVVISEVTEWVAKREEWLTGFVSNPPAELTRHRNMGRKTVTYTAQRPEGFDPSTERRSYRSDSYDTMFFNLKDEAEQDIKSAKRHIEYLKKRLADWKPFTPTDRELIALKKIAPGSYTATVNGRVKRIKQNDDHSTSWCGQWAITDVNDPTEYSDPIPTLKDCIKALAEQVKK